LAKPGEQAAARPCRKVGGAGIRAHPHKNTFNIRFHKIFSEISKKLFKILQICGKVVSIGEMCSNSPLREPALCKI
jgi:hypothetical protein